MDDSPRKKQWWLIATAAILAVVTLYYYTGSWMIAALFLARNLGPARHEVSLAPKTRSLPERRGSRNKPLWSHATKH